MPANIFVQPVLVTKMPFHNQMEHGTFIGVRAAYFFFGLELRREVETGWALNDSVKA